MKFNLAKYGEEISRLQISSDFIQKAIALSKNPNCGENMGQLSEFLTKILSRLRPASKDNDTIYLEPIPPYRSLTPIQRLMMASPASIQEQLSKHASTGTPFFNTVKIISLFNSGILTYIILIN